MPITPKTGSLFHAETHVYLGSDGHPVFAHRRSLRRTFNNGHWRQGGRLAGGFWMSMRRIDRFERIRIDGEPIADVDYRQLFPRIAYERARAEQPLGDIYDVAGDGSCRDGWKTLMNAMLFAQRPLKNWPEDTSQLFPAGTKLKDAITLLRQRHAPISDLFETGIGFELMHIESNMLISILTYLASVGVTALPLHDAVLVRQTHANVAQAAMQHAFTRDTGSSCAIVSVDLGQ